jgi:hypothetical protein
MGGLQGRGVVGPRITQTTRMGPSTFIEVVNNYGNGLTTDFTDDTDKIGVVILFNGRSQSLSE